jgi:hypothetical protein
MNSHTDPIIKLTFDECWELLSADIVGRLALVVDSHPEISTGRRFRVNKPDVWNTRTTDRRRASFD